MLGNVSVVESVDKSSVIVIFQTVPSLFFLELIQTIKNVIKFNIKGKSVNRPWFKIKLMI